MAFCFLNTTPQQAEIRIHKFPFVNTEIFPIPFVLLPGLSPLLPANETLKVFGSQTPLTNLKSWR